MENNLLLTKVFKQVTYENISYALKYEWGFFAQFVNCLGKLGVFSQPVANQTVFFVLCLLLQGAYVPDKNWIEESESVNCRVLKFLFNIIFLYYRNCDYIIQI